MASAGLKLASLLEDCAELWQLRLGEPYPAGAAGHAVRAELPDGTPAVLKLSLPHRESLQEADALDQDLGRGRHLREERHDLVGEFSQGLIARAALLARR